MNQSIQTIKDPVDGMTMMVVSGMKREGVLLDLEDQLGLTCWCKYKQKT
jgi:hypothetical protein